jgi:hypothetical protein
MQLAAREALRQPVLVRAIAATVALAFCGTAIVMIVWMLLASQPAALPPVQRTAPVSAPGEYRLPSEPIDYSDPNYIGSYGG